jgi:hypothetical protein
MLHDDILYPDVPIIASKLVGWVRRGMLIWRENLASSRVVWWGVVDVVISFIIDE